MFGVDEQIPGRRPSDQEAKPPIDASTGAAAPVGDWMRLRVGDRVRAIGPEASTQRLAQFDMRLVAKLVEKGRARWTAYGVRLIGKVT